MVLDIEFLRIARLLLKTSHTVIILARNFLLFINHKYSLIGFRPGLRLQKTVLLKKTDKHFNRNKILWSRPSNFGLTPRAE